MRLGGGRVMHEDVLLAVLVEVHQPGVFVAGHRDRHFLRPPGEQFRSVIGGLDGGGTRSIPAWASNRQIAGPPDSETGETAPVDVKTFALEEMTAAEKAAHPLPDATA